jgi:hypothetical protein
LGDAFKGATTDGLTKICSYLGIGIDVFRGKQFSKVSTPVPIANTSIPVKDSVENKEASEIEAHIKKALVDDKNLMIKQKDFRSTPEGAHFQSCASIPDVVKFNDIELVRSFYRFIKKK